VLLPPAACLCLLAVAQLLTLAMPRGPAGLPQPDAGAVLALACHVVMVQAGFQVGMALSNDPAVSDATSGPPCLPQYAVAEVFATAQLCY
jgi:hypothetical protein